MMAVVEIMPLITQPRFLTDLGHHLPGKEFPLLISHRHYSEFSKLSNLRVDLGFSLLPD